MDTIKAMVLSKYGPPEVLHVGKVPRPSPARDEVLVQVQAAGVGLADCRRRTGELSLLSSAQSAGGAWIRRGRSRGGGRCGRARNPSR